MEEQGSDKALNVPAGADATVQELEIPGSEAETAIAAPSNEPLTYRFTDRIVVLSDHSSAEAESIAALRTHLLAHHVRLGRRGLAICAPDRNAGSTFVAVNLAVALARAGIKTLLIDANMRNPSVHRMIVPSREMPALRECLAEQDANYGEVIQEEVLPHLSVIFSGGKSTRAQELLSGQRFKSLLDLCMRDFEVTIVDTPASNNNADGRRIASITRYCAIVARKDNTYISDVSTLVDEMKADKINVVGTILNEF